jgi:hypothetical protein
MRRRPLWAAALVAALVAHALLTKRGAMTEMLWLCHVATATIALGLALARPLLVATGFVFHVGLGIELWLLDIAATGVTTPTSVVVHLLPLGAAIAVFRRVPLPRRAWLAAWTMCLVMLPISLLATDPALNVNLVWAPWKPLESMHPDVNAHRVVMCVIALIAMRTSDAVLRRALPAFGPVPPGDAARAAVVGSDV